MAEFNKDININDTAVTTTFVDDGTSLKNDLTTKIIGGDYVIKEQRLADFFAKPQLVTNFSWNTGDAALTQKYAFDPGNEILTNVYYSAKRQGYKLLRGDAILTVMINAMPFQQGRLVAHFLPQSAVNTAIDRNCTLLQITQQPNIEIGCRDTAVSLSIPYATQVDWIDTINSSQYVSWGSFYITVLSPLLVGTAAPTTVDVSVYIHYENVEFACPIYPQSGKPVKGIKVKKFKSTEEMESFGTISTNLGRASKIVGSLSVIPSISGVAGSASWVLDALSGIAAHFGWSKPTSRTHCIPVSQQLARDSATCDGEFVGSTLALKQGNRISLSDKVCLRDEDEMSFAFLKNVNAYVTYFNWTTSDVTGDVLQTYEGGPLAFTVGNSVPVTVNAKTLTGYAFHPVDYLSRHFQLWRGGIRLTFKMVKTQFHSGRLELVWNPVKGAVTGPAPGTSTLALRQIIDVSTTDSFVIELPYLEATRYLAVGTFSGCITISVLNELRAPDSVPATINILVYLSYCDDFELAVPVVDANPMSSVSIQSGQWSKEADVSIPIGGVATQMQDVEHSALCIGELFSSVRQLITKFQPLRNAIAWPTNGFAIWPWAVGPTFLVPVTGALSVQQQFGGDAFGIIAPMYAYYRGGMRILIKGDEGSAFYLNNRCATNLGDANSTLNSLTAPVTALGNGIGSVWYNSAGAAANPGGFAGTAITNSNVGVHAFELPFYSDCKLAPTNFGVDYTAGTIPPGLGKPKSRLNFVGASGANPALLVERACSEDFQLSYFIGVPLSFYTYA